MKVGSLVTRVSHNNDLLFRVVAIDNFGKVFLKGEELRLYADSTLDDLREEEVKKIRVSMPKLPVVQDDSLIKGKVLHLDGDPYYLRKAMEAYSFYNVQATGFFVHEKDMKNALPTLLHKDSYDILVLTGHDGIKTNQQLENNNLTSYRNSYNYVLAVQEARLFYEDKDSLVIIAGACQSYYEALISSGANFASSPNRKNIHLLDPIVIASSVASIRVSEYIEVESILLSTISKQMGGIDTRGKARRNFFGGKKQSDYG